MGRFLGVWDTVGALGLPEPFREESKIFGFNDSILGDHIERAYQALALNETRLDFVCLFFDSYPLLNQRQICNKFHQTEMGRAKNQIVKQVWFPGAHSDVSNSQFPLPLAQLVSNNL